MTSFGLESGTPENISPSLSLGDFRGERYPNQFFDLAQQYMPPTIKELFRWCTFYYYNSPLIGSALKKVSRYPITDLILEDDIESNRQVWNKILVKTLKIKDRLMEINLDAHVYGNAFVSAHLPFTRFLICKKCSSRQPISQWTWDFKGSNFNFSGKCPSCSHTGEVDVKDVPYRDIKGVRLIRWNPENIYIKFNEYTGRYIYMYSVPPKLRTMIQRGDRDVLEDIPMVVLEALRKRRMIRFNPDSIFHIKAPTLAEQDQGWGKPTIIHVLKDMYYLYTLRRAQEAIAMEHIVPFDIIYPMPNAQVDPYVHTDLASWRVQLEAIIKKHKRDPNFKAIIPVPVGFGRLGGDGKALLLSPEMNYLTQTIVGGMGIPQEFLFGGLNFCLVPESYIVSSKGLVRLEEICPETVSSEAPKTPTTVSTKDGDQKIALLHNTGKRPQRGLRTALGLILKGSPIHRVWTLNQDCSMTWKTLNEIRPGDYVAVKKGSELWGDGTPSKELCRLLGYLVSEGSISRRRGMSFCNTDKDILEDFQNCFENVFGTRLKIQWRTMKQHHYGAKDIGTIETRSKKVLDYLESIDMMHYAYSKRIPYVIRSATKECVSEFFKALFEGDGCLPKRKIKQGVFYSSVSARLLEEIQLLLLNMGIVSSRYSGYDGNIPSLQIRSEYTTEYMQVVGFVSKRKNAAYNAEIKREAFRCDSAKYPYLVENLKSLKIDYVNWESVREIDPGLYERATALIDSGFAWDRVVETSESCEEVPMCDLTVFETHSYVANGIVSHNTGSSISLRTLENDFIQNRSQLLDFVVWLKDKIRVWMGLPDIHSIRMADFRMADDVQRNQQLIGLNAQGKVSDHTLLSELGFDFEQEMRKMMEESHAKNHLAEAQTKSSARTQGEAQLIQFNYQQRIQELASEAQALLQQKQQAQVDQPGAEPSGAPGAQEMAPSQEEEGAQAQQGGVTGSSVQKRLTEWAKKISLMPPDQAQATVNEIKLKMPDVGQALEQRIGEVQAGPAAQVNMDPMPEQKPPRRPGAL